MTSPKTTRFTLKEGQKFTTCSPSSSSCTGTTNTTSRSRDGELEITYGSDGRPDNATFYYPSKAECIDSFDPVRKCDLEATFEGKELQELRDSNTELAKYWPNVTEEKQLVNTQVNTDIPDRGANNLPQFSGEDANWFGFPNILFAIPVIVLVVYLGNKALKSVLSPPRISQKSSRNRQQASLSYQQTSSPSITDDIRRQLSSFQLQLDKLNTKIDSLETEMIVIGQKIESGKPKVSQPLSPQTLPPTPFPIAQVVRQLDVGLIKEAVATADYNLIKNFTHDFVTETLDSRQGKEESVRFSIDGNQDTSEQRAQSEFIAITYANQTYLIPNILPNATDPARTIKRHVDRNKVYRGDGQNLLSLSEVATVEKSGESYVLAKPGRIG